MTDKELAEGYYYKTYPVTLSIGEEERKKKVTDIFLAGLKAGRPKWHDLRKDPNDLPKDENDVLVYSGEDWRMCVGRYSPKYKVWEAGCDTIAWCEIPTFDKE